MVVCTKAFRLGRALTEEKGSTHMGPDESVASWLGHHVLDLPRQLLLGLHRAFQGLEERDSARVYDTILDVVDVDGTANVQTASLGQLHWVVATVPVVVIRQSPVKTP